MLEILNILGAFGPKSDHLSGCCGERKIASLKFHTYISTATGAAKSVLNPALLDMGTWLWNRLHYV